ncbi:MAG: Rieske (2Fe-2S) protein [Fimbriimonas sp.]
MVWVILGALADGLTGESTVICPFHGRKFDLVTGEASEGCGVQTYPVQLGENGVIMVTLPFTSNELTHR